MATYTVQRDDTLGKVAQRFHTTWQALKTLNNLANANVIVPGQLLKLPGDTDASHPDLVKPITTAGARGPITTQLPLSGTGFVTYNPDDAQGSDRYGTAGFVEALKALGLAWSATGFAPVSFGDMSHKNGTAFPPHKGHTSGREADIRAFRKDRLNAPATWLDPAYDRNVTQQFVVIIKQQHANAAVFFNDPVLRDAGLVRPLAGHDNHLHLQIYDNA